MKKVDPFSSGKDKYNAGYFEWLWGFFIHFVKIPWHNSDELKECLGVIWGMLWWMIIMLFFPITIPIITAMVMYNTKRDLREEYGHDELTSKE